MAPKQGKAPRANHVFRGVREALVSDLTTKATMLAPTSAGGSTNTYGVLAPFGLRAAAWNGTAFVNQVVEQPHLIWLSNTATSFGMYRVTRAKLVFVGNAGANTAGTVNLFTSPNVIDAGATVQTAFTTGPGARSFDLATASNKEQSVSVMVDSSWKKCSIVLSYPGGTAPFASSTSTSSIPCATADDLSFGGFQVQVVGAPASTNVGTLFLEYDVEFKGPISSNMNL